MWGPGVAISEHIQHSPFKGKKKTNNKDIDKGELLLSL